MKVAVYPGEDPTGFCISPEMLVVVLLQELSNPDDEPGFVLISDAPASPAEQAGNTVFISSFRPGRSLSSLGKWWWKHVKLPAYLKRERIGVLLSLNSPLPRTGDARQLLWLTDQARALALITRDLHGSERLIVTHAWIRKQLLNQLNAGSGAGLDPGSGAKLNAGAGAKLDPRPDVKSGAGATAATIDKIRVIPRGPMPGFASPGEVDGYAIRDQHTEGRNYFLVTGPIDRQLLPVLKAFSIYKKRQKTNWKLVLVSTGGRTETSFVRSLEQYKYREDLVMMDDAVLADLPPLFHAAYALILPGQSLPFSLIPECLQAGVPVLAPDLPVYKEEGGDALLYYGAGINDLADAMMQLYKDEALRDRMISAGRLRNRPGAWRQTADEIVNFATLNPSHNQLSK